jgi:hypothetical protein
MSEIYSENNHQLALYDRLLQRTTCQHTDAIEKHITVFTKFCTENAATILERGTNFVSTIQFSPKVYIDMTEMFRLSGANGGVNGGENVNENADTLHKHLLVLLAVLCGDEAAKEQLKQTNYESKLSAYLNFDPSTNEGEFLNSLVGKVEGIIGQDTNLPPMEVYQKITSSGMQADLFSDISSKIASGSIDMKKLFATAQKAMAGVVSNLDESDPENAQLLSLMKLIPTNLPGMQ